MRKVTTEGAPKINGIPVNNIRYADDNNVLLAESKSSLEHLLANLKDESEKRGLFINKKKTKVMVFSKNKVNPKCEIVLDGEVLQQSNSFEYLGSVLTSNGKCDAEIRRRIAISKKMFMDKKNILTNKTINVEQKKRLLRVFIWPVLLYGCEAWTISKKMQKQIEATELWFYRRMMRIPWMKLKTNEEVLEMVKETRTMMSTIRRRQVRFVGHISREKGLEKVCLEGKLEGNKGRGRPRQSFMNGLTLATGMDSSTLLHKAHKSEWFQETGRQRQSLTRYTKKKI